MRSVKFNRIIVFIFLLINVFLVLNLCTLVIAEPDEDLEDYDDCHEKGDYEISSKTEDSLNIEKSEEFNIDIITCWIRINRHTYRF